MNPVLKQKPTCIKFFVCSVEDMKTFMKSKNFIHISGKGNGKHFLWRIQNKKSKVDN